MKPTLAERIKDIKPAQLIFPLIVLFIFAGAIIGIVNYQSKKKTILPKLEITSPADGADVSDSQIVVSGKTVTGNKLKINQKDASVDKKGGFYTEVPLSYGINSILVAVENKSGKKNEKTLKVTRNTADGTVAPTSGTNAPASTKTPAAQSDIAPVVPVVPVATATGDGKGNLNNSGPETFWLFESASLAAAGAAWFTSRKKLSSLLKTK